MLFGLRFCVAFDGCDLLFWGCVFDCLVGLVGIVVTVGLPLFTCCLLLLVCLLC